VILSESLGSDVYSDFEEGSEWSRQVWAQAHNRPEWLSRRVDHTALSRSVCASRGSTRCAARKQLNSQRVDVTFPGKVRAERGTGILG
jgi:hypothetical protein